MKYKTQLSYLSFNESNSGPGVYKITIISTGQYYIGSSKNVKKRIIQHMTAAKYTRHTIDELNKCYSAFGKDGFSFELLCSASPAELLDIENSYQELANKELLLRKQVVRKIKKEEKSKKPLRSLEHITGEIREFHNIAEFCRINNLSVRAIGRVLSRLANSHQGWYRRGEVPLNKQQTIIKPKPKRKVLTKELINPNGELVIITNISAFCRENNFNLGSFGDMLRGKVKSYKGWKLPGTRILNSIVPISGTLYHIHGAKENFESIAQFEKKYNISSSYISKLISKKVELACGWYLPTTDPQVYYLTHPEFGSHIHWNLSEFCLQNNLKYKHMQRVLSGERKSYHGWAVVHTNLSLVPTTTYVNTH